MLTATVAVLLLRIPTYEGVGFGCPLSTDLTPSWECPGPLLTWSDAIRAGLVLGALVTAAVALAIGAWRLSHRLRERRGREVAE